MKKCFVKKLISCPVSFSVRFGTTARRGRHPVIKDADGGESALFFFYTCTPHSPFSPSIFFFFFPSHFGSASRGRWMCGGGDDTCQRQRLQVRRSLAARSSRRARTLQQAGRGNQPTSPLHPPWCLHNKWRGWVVEGRRGGHVSVRL